MSTVPQLRSQRLILRAWRDQDREPFAALNADPRVREHFPSTLSRAESDAVVGRMEGHFARHGFGPWASLTPTELRALVCLRQEALKAVGPFMAPIIPDPKKIRSFPSAAAFEAWLSKNHARETEIWLRVYKKDSGVPTVSCAQALESVLCWGWIDGIRKAFDEDSFLQRYTPRRARSVWSQINRGHVARLTAAGRMTPHGQRHIDAARADGRWEAAYAPIRSATEATIPADLRAAIDASPRAGKTLRTLGRQNLFALAFRTNNMKTPAGRAKKIAALVAMLERGETITPESPLRSRGSSRR